MDSPAAKHDLFEPRDPFARKDNLAPPVLGQRLRPLPRHPARRYKRRSSGGAADQLRHHDGREYDAGWSRRSARALSPPVPSAAISEPAHYTGKQLGRRRCAISSAVARPPPVATRPRTDRHLSAGRSSATGVPPTCPHRGDGFLAPSEQHQVELQLVSGLSSCTGQDLTHAAPRWTRAAFSYTFQNGRNYTCPTSQAQATATTRVLLRRMLRPYKLRDRRQESLNCPLRYEATCRCGAWGRDLPRSAQFSAGRPWSLQGSSR